MCTKPYEEISLETLPRSVALTEIFLIEQINGGIWRVVSSYLDSI